MVDNHTCTSCSCDAAGSCGCSCHNIDVRTIHRWVWNHSYIDQLGLPVYLLESPNVETILRCYLNGDFGAPDTEVKRVAKRALARYSEAVEV